ncbi:hypothetical protein J1N35_043670 [Gossypium stocksii]|uniref:Uncharacterized protein n=1 Tax=Gossypium stocksii TaxID=47602 RepID=A0A9D3U7P3_9ROSI|nr:hypothetical protein J1N35_043670 [Gossypium stocksii]
MDLTQVDARLNTRLKEFREEMHSKMKGLFEQYMGPTSATTRRHSLDEGKEL